MRTLDLKPTHKAVKDYYSTLEALETHGADHEGAVREAFSTLLSHCARRFKWTMILEHAIRTRNSGNIRVDAALMDEFSIPHGYWEAKDSNDDLDSEIKIKFEKGYPRDNIIFQQPDRAVLIQDGDMVLDANLKDPDKLVRILKEFFEYTPPNILDWEQAVDEFQERVPELAAGVLARIRKERETNSDFIAAFSSFLELCRQSINPNLSENAVE